VLGGNERGVAQLFFNADGSLSGRALFTFTGRAVATYTNRGVLYTNFLGGAYLLGQWSYASPTTTNRIVGIINGVSSPAGSTTLTTNGLSFHGLVGRSKLTLLAVGYQGNVSFQGIRLRATNDLTGGYYATGQKRGAPTPFVEVFNLIPPPALEYLTNTVITPFDCSTTKITSTTNTDLITGITSITNYVVITQQVCFATNTAITTISNDVTANYYFDVGSGPAYEYTGPFLVSSQHYAALLQARGVNSAFITVYAGPFNPVTGRGLLLGTDGTSRNIKFSIYHGPR